MYQTIEKIMAIKKVPLFYNVPELALSDFVSLSEEVNALVGSDILKQDQRSDGFYIVLQGLVRVHDKGKTRAELGPYKHFGLLEALSPSAAPFTVTALEDSTLYRIAQKDLLRLMTDWGALGSNVLSLLCQRLRPIDPLYF